MWNFNSQPHKEADYFADVVPRFQKYFNSQPHKEADCQKKGLPDRLGISIHSLTRRLTAKTGPFICRFFISIHSLTRRLTRCWLRIDLYIWHFNSQPHKEADRRKGFLPKTRSNFNSQPHKEADFFNPYLRGGKKISIHSLTRRLTGSLNFKRAITIFQFTASQGGWRRRMKTISGIKLFQFTASQGGWPRPARNY